MIILSWEEFGRVGGASGPLAAAVGVFDGLHLGHMRLLEEVLARDGLAKGVVTFKENPKKVLRPSGFHGDLFTLGQKLDRFAALGLDVCVLIDFSGDFSKLAGRKFLSLLREKGDLRFLAVGADFRCGYRLDTGAEEIKSYYDEYGVESRLLDPVLWAGKPVSSSRIRRAIIEGRLDDARSMLGRDFELDMRAAAVSVQADGRIRLIPERGQQVEPPEGTYEAVAGWEREYRPVLAAYKEGAWALSFGNSSEIPQATMPTALRIMKLVSRE